MSFFKCYSYLIREIAHIMHSQKMALTFQTFYLLYKNTYLCKEIKDNFAQHKLNILT